MTAPPRCVWLLIALNWNSRGIKDFLPAHIFSCMEDWSMDVRMTDRTALITGASMGLGRAMGNKFAKAGADIALVARRLGRGRLVLFGLTATSVVLHLLLVNDWGGLRLAPREMHRYQSPNRPVFFVQQVVRL